jgi:hypothetical protein
MDRYSSYFTILVRISSEFQVHEHPHLNLIHDRTFKQLKAPIDAAIFELPEAIPKEGIFIIDTAILFAALVGQEQNKHGLEQICNQLQIKTEFLHNAGNDAYVRRLFILLGSTSPFAVYSVRFALDGLRRTTRRAERNAVAQSHWSSWHQFRCQGAISAVRRGF